MGIPDGMPSSTRPGRAVARAALIAACLAAGAAQVPATPAAPLLADTLSTQQWSDTLVALSSMQVHAFSSAEVESLASRLTRQAIRERGETSREALEARHIHCIALVADGRSQDSTTIALARELVEWADRAKGLKIGIRRQASATLAGILLRNGDGSEGHAIVDSLLAADTTDAIAGVCWAQLAEHGFQHSDLVLAERASGRALELLRKNRDAWPSPESVEAGLLANLSAIKMFQGNLGEARRLFGQAEEIANRTGFATTQHWAIALMNSGTQWYYAGDLDQAARCLERALVIQKRYLRPDHPDLERTLGNAAAVAQARGDLKRSDVIDRELVATIERIHGPHAPELAAPLKNLAQLEMQLGAYEDSRRLLDRALRIEEAQPDSNGIAEANTLGALGGLCVRTGAYAEARGFLERALRVYDARPSARRPETITVLNNLADLCLRTRAFDEAAAHVERARALLRETRAQRGAVTLAMTGAEIALAGGRLDEARARMESAADAVKALPPLHPDVTDYEGMRSRVLAARGDIAGATLVALGAADAQRRHVTIVSRYLTERQAMSYAERCRRWLDYSLTMALADAGPRPTRALFDGVIRARGLVLDEMALRHHAVHTSTDPEVRALADSLAEAGARLAYAYLLPVPVDTTGQARQRRRIAEAAADKERFERALTFRNQDVTDATGAGFDVAALAAALPAQSVLVSYVRVLHHSELDVPGDRGVTRNAGNDQYLAFVMVPGDSAPAMLDLGSATRVDSLVLRWRSRAGPPFANESRAFGACVEVGQQLRHTIWDPVSARLAGARRVFVVPDGALALVSFDALPLGSQPVRGAAQTVATCRFLVDESYVIHYLTSERDLPRDPDVPAPGGRMLVLGSPDYDRTVAIPFSKRRTLPMPAATAVAYRGRLADCADLVAKRYEPLPGTRLEAQDVAQLWRSPSHGREAEVLTEAAASEAAFKNLAPNHRVLHVATHGFFVDESCAPGSPGTHGTDERGAGVPASNVVRENPLVQSGLVLAGANQRAHAPRGGEDGMLTAEEIAALDLEGTQWVVLSACGTGLGAVRAGEGVQGLKRVFRLAGAKTVIASLWPVGDVSAQEWMRELYAEWLGGRSTMDAMHAANVARLTLLRKRRMFPYASRWAAFTASGDWR